MTTLLDWLSKKLSQLGDDCVVIADDGATVMVKGL